MHFRLTSFRRPDVRTGQYVRRSVTMLLLVVMCSLPGCESPDSSDTAVPPVMMALEEIESAREGGPDMMPGLDRNFDPVPGDIPAGGIYEVTFNTTAGDFVIEVNRAWGPRAADRFYKLVKDGYFDDSAFFRVVPGFVVQWGLSGDPRMTRKWDINIPDEARQQSNARGTISFANGGPNTRSTQVFINFRDNTQLDGMGFVPFGRVTSGMDIVDAINADAGEEPDQGIIRSLGNEYLRSEFPNLDYITSARITSDDADSATTSDAGTESASPESSPVAP